MTPTEGPSTPPRRVRLADVAAGAGVTKSTASRVLNGDATLSIRAETRQRIAQVARDLGYQPHAGARALALHQTRALALLIPDLTNLTYARIIRGAFQRAKARGYVLLIAEDDGDLTTDESFADLVRAQRVDGLIVASARPGDPISTLLSDHQVPHVFVNRAIPGSGRNVTMDNAAASRIAVEHLVELGHRRVGHVAGHASIVPARERETEFRRACGDSGLAEYPVRRSEFSAKGGYRATKQLLREHPDLTALYVSTFTQAIGTLKAARDSGRQVPDQLSVVTYDDLAQADYVDPPLTTVAMPLVELGAASVDALVDQLAGKPPSDVVVPTGPALIRRASTAPAPPSA
jgi:DNA-binding LacI/PurR family transcriptional regulator